MIHHKFMKEFKPNEFLYSYKLKCGCQKGRLILSYPSKFAKRRHRMDRCSGLFVNALASFLIDFLSFLFTAQVCPCDDRSKCRALCIHGHQAMHGAAETQRFNFYVDFTGSELDNLFDSMKNFFRILFGNIRLRMMGGIEFLGGGQYFTRLANNQSFCTRCSDVDSQNVFQVSGLTPVK